MEGAHPDDPLTRVIGAHQQLRRQFTELATGQIALTRGLIEISYQVMEIAQELKRDSAARTARWSRRRVK